MSPARDTGFDSGEKHMTLTDVNAIVPWLKSELCEFVVVGVGRNKFRFRSFGGSC